MYGVGAAIKVHNTRAACLKNLDASNQYVVQSCAPGDCRESTPGQGKV